MKILLVALKEETEKVLYRHLHPRGFEIIHYWNPIKAMDNIEEIRPDLILFSSEDFPRHWKPFLILLRQTFSRDKAVFILLKGKIFPFEEAAKALYLGVNGIISEDFSDRRRMKHIEDVLSRYKTTGENRGFDRYIPLEDNELEFIFTHPVTLNLITGFIYDISIEGASFKPDSPQLTVDLSLDSEIPYCSLTLENTVISLSAKVVRNNEIIGLRFTQIDDENRQLLKEYLEKSLPKEYSVQSG